MSPLKDKPREELKKRQRKSRGKKKKGNIEKSENKRATTLRDQGELKEKLYTETHMDE